MISKGLTKRCLDFLKWAQKNKERVVDAYFECQSFGKRPADKFAFHTENATIRNAIDEIVHAIGYPEDLKLKAKLAGLEWR